MFFIRKQIAFLYLNFSQYFFGLVHFKPVGLEQILVPYISFETNYAGQKIASIKDTDIYSYLNVYP